MSNTAPENTRFTVVIPARYASSRLPGKALLEIGGKSLIERVHERAAQSSADRVIIATDDARVEQAALDFGAEVMLTSDRHTSGTERTAEVVERLGLTGSDVVVNVQGDEPLIPPANINQVARNLAMRPDVSIATLCELIESDAALFDPNVVKVVLNALGEAMYFSRAPIPWHRDHLTEHARTRAPGAQFYRHIGIYAYHAGYITGYAAAEPTSLECAEALEQLRALYTGARIHVELALEPPGPGVDTPADLELARTLVADMSASGS